MDGGRFCREHETFKGGVKLAYEEVERSHLRWEAPRLTIVGHDAVKCGEGCDRGVVEIIAIKKLWAYVEPVDM